jgi:predicted metal-dependent HD superfamily phosphohydrolase
MKTSWVNMSNELYRVYNAPSRRYHNLDHITELFDEMNKNLDLVENEEALRVAIWWHDYYQDHNEDEERSATKGYEAALAMGYSEVFARIVHRLILVTKHKPADLSYAPQTNDECLMCDLDLVPLAAHNFTERTGWIREEYPDVPTETFFPARRAILRGFLSRDAIYYLPRFQALYEAKARYNIRLSTECKHGILLDDLCHYCSIE